MPPHADLSGADLQACVRLMRGGSRSFFAASRLLPPRVRDGAVALYAFCRVADDLVDEPPPGIDGPAVLRARLDAIYAGRPTGALEDQALALLVAGTGLPRAPLDALLEGFAWDAQGRRPADLPQLLDYAARVAGTVGVLMAWVMGRRDEATLARAAELGLAMQLTNICRDVGEDARNGRLYLPQDWLHAAGISPEEFLRAPRCTPALRSVVARLLDEADRLYARAEPGIARLPPDCRPAILGASRVYREIGHALRRRGLDPVARRTVVGGGRKLVLLAGARVQAPWLRERHAPPPPQGAVAELVRACAGPAEDTRALRPLGQRLDWMLELFERLEQGRRGPA